MIVGSIVSNAADRSSSTSVAALRSSNILSLCCGLDDKRIAFAHIGRCLSNV